MSELEGIFIWAAIGLYALSFVAALISSVFRKRPGPGLWMLWSAAILHGAAVGARWIATGHPPVMGVYENSLLGSWFLSVTYLVLMSFFPSLRTVHVFLSPVILLLIGNGIQSRPELEPLEPPYRSNWLYVHVLFAWLAFGSYVTAAVTGAITLLRKRIAGLWSITVPDDRLLDELSFRLILFGFFSEAIMIGSGAIWAHGLWGRYWGWDPVETWSLISWLTYGLNLHLRLTYGWRGRKAAWLAIISLFGVIALFFGIGFISGVHTQMMG